MPIDTVQLHSLLASIAAEINKFRESSSGLSSALTIIAEYFDARGAMILREEGPTTLSLAAQVGELWDEDNIPAELMEATYAEVFRYGRATNVSPGAFGPTPGVLGAPLQIGERQIGGIFLNRSADQKPFSSAEMDILHLLGLALAIQIESREDYRRISARRAELEAVHSSMVDGLIVVDRRGYLSSFNETFKKVSLIPAHDLYGLGWPQIIRPRTHPAMDAKQMLAAFEEALQVGQPFVTTGCPAFLVKPDGTEVPVAVGMATIIEDGKVTGGVLNIRDATVEAQLERLKDDFIATVSHELNTPLTSIRGFVELMRNHNLPRAEVLPLFDVILDECRRLGRMITDLLDLGKIQSGMVALHLEKFIVAKMIDQAVKPFRIRFEDTHAISVEVAPAAGQMVADRDRILQIIVNLVGNAIKYSPSGGKVAVTARKVKSDWEFTISDQGIGIPETHLPRLFGRFFRVNEQQSTGFGLGLFITKSLVERHGGRITVESTDGLGTTFKLQLPVITRESRPEDRLSRQRSKN